MLPSPRLLGFDKFPLDVLLGLNNNLRYQNLTAVISKRSAYPAIRVMTVGWVQGEKRVERGMPKQEKAFKASSDVISGIEQRSFSGKRIELFVNGAPMVVLKTEHAVAADYLLFLDGVLRALLLDKANLEKEARASGKTMQHDNFDALGTITVTDAKDP